MIRKTTRVFLITALGSLTLGTIIAISEKIITGYIDSILPKASKVTSYSRPGTITLISTNNKIIQKLGPVSRQNAQPGEIPLIVKQAFIAAEDKRFYKHHGVDIWGISRALITNIRKREVVEGASTITQQLARIIFLNQERTYTRKLKEIALAYKLERNFTKEEILVRYLNNVYLGSNAYGISNAAWIYFSKTPAQLTLEEAALIAGLPPAPSLYSPLVNNKLAAQRRTIVLKRMNLQGFISHDELIVALKSPITLKPASPKFLVSRAPYFTSWVEQKLPSLLTKEQLEIGGLKVKTSLNLVWQSKARKIIKNHNHDNRESALVSIEPSTGLVRVLIGGTDFNKSQFNRATQAFRSPGSTFKIFPYAVAINEGYKPEDIFFDTPRCWYGYCPKNFGGRYFGEVSLSEAFSKSLNTIAVDLLTNVGFKKVINLANQLGVGNEVKLGKYYPLAIGAYEENLLNMTGAYAGIANRGIYLKPSPIEEIRGPDNSILWNKDLNAAKAKRVVPNNVADTLNWMLKKVVSEGTGQAASMKKLEVAGKTGTSEGNRDLWFIGSVPKLTTGVWLGHDNNKPTNSSSGEAALIWKKFIQSIESELKGIDFPAKPTD